MARRVRKPTGGVVVYLRVSTTRQATEGVSLDAQRARAEGWAIASGREVLGVLVDAGISGKSTDNRPGLAEAVELACKTRSALVVYSLSRLARSTKDACALAERLDKAGADLVSLSESIDTTSATGRLVFRLLASLAEFERELTGERTATALAHKASLGHRVGRFATLGYRLVPSGEGERGEQAIDPGEQEAVARMVELRGAGLSLREVACRLAADGFVARSGRPFSPSVIAKTVLNRSLENRQAAA